MEQIKIYDKYIAQLSNFDSLNNKEQELLIEKIARVVFNEVELEELSLNYYTLYSQNNNKEDATKLKSKLELKRAKLIDDNDIENRKYEVQKMELEKMRIQEQMKDKNFVINNNNNNEAISCVNVSTSFEEVRRKIDNMTALTEPEIEEIKNKINEIESIVNSTNSKQKKWSKVKDIIKWIADKGVDVGIALLPLILQIVC